MSTYFLINKALTKDGNTHCISIGTIDNHKLALLKYITFNFTKNIINEEEFYEFVKEIIVTLEIGGSILYMHKLSLLINLDKPKILDNQVVVNLPYKYFCNKINIDALQYHRVEFIIQIRNINENNLLKNIMLCTQYSDKNNYGYNNEQLFNTLQLRRLQDIVSIYIESQINNTTIKLNLSNYFKLGTCRGYFIEGNIKNLKNIKLLLNNDICLNLNKAMIQTECKNINDKMLYLPLNYGNFDYTKYKNIDKEIRRNCFLNNKTNNINMILTYETIIEDIYAVHCLINYYMGTNNGLATIMSPSKQRLGYTEDQEKIITI